MNEIHRDVQTLRMAKKPTAELSTASNLLFGDCDDGMRFFTTVRWDGIFILVGALFCSAQLVMATSIGAFTANGTVLTQSFETGGTNVVFELEAQFAFSYSNGWWGVQSVYERGIYPGMEKENTPLSGTLLDCARIEDGVRLFFDFQQLRQGKSQSNAPLPAASAFPIQCPPPEHMVLFLPWLTLCPNPELPLIGDGLIRRFTASSLMNDPRNRAGFSVNYIEPERAFLSELQITNKGVIFVRGGEVSHLPKPFDRGYLDLSYQVLEVTNFNGIPFPSLSILRQFWPSRHAITSEDVVVVSVTRLQIDSLQAGVSHPVETPTRMVALDARPTGLPANATVNYIVANDQWRPLTNSVLKRLAGFARRPSETTALILPINGRRLVVWLFFIGTLAGAILLIRAQRKHTTKRERD